MPSAGGFGTTRRGKRSAAPDADAIPGRYGNGIRIRGGAALAPAWANRFANPGALLRGRVGRRPVPESPLPLRSGPDVGGTGRPAAERLSRVAALVGRAGEGRGRRRL